MRLALLLVTVVACQKGDDKIKIDTTGSAAPNAGSGRNLPKVEPVTPKIDIKTFPADATKTSSGLVYKKLVENASGQAPGRNDTVLIHYVGWTHATGDTFFNSRAMGSPVAVNLWQQKAGFAEAIQVVKKGETAMLWVPPEVGVQGPGGTPEMLVYEVEVVGIEPAPPIPPDYKAPPADALKSKTGVPYVRLAEGAKEKARYFDTVTFDYTAWDATGRMVDSTAMRKRPATVPPFRQAAVMEDILTMLGKGERIRFWVDSEKMTVGGINAGVPPGVLCYELEVKDIVKAPGVPPPAPPDVKAPPPDVPRTDRGVAYRVLKKGKGGPKPGPTDTVKVTFTGWTTDGRMFDSSIVKGEVATFALNGTISGWTEAIPLMSVGDRMRFWIPDELAYKGAPGKPQGMLVFDVELLEIKPEGVADAKQPVPPDVAAPPPDAKKSPKGVFYKILKPAKKPGPKPAATDTIRVHYTGWTTDGTQFDSSIGRDPMELRLSNMIDGWIDTFPLLQVGDKARMWIPQELAYQGQEGAPKGMLVFDVELVEIKK